MISKTASAIADAIGIATERPSQTTSANRLQELDPTGHAPKGQPTAKTLGRRHEIRDDLLMFAGEPDTGPAHAGLDLIGDEENTVLATPLRLRDSEPTFTGDGSTTTPVIATASTVVSKSEMTSSSRPMPRKGYEYGAQ